MASGTVTQEAPTKETIIQRLRESYPYLAAEYGVRRIGLFGSFAQGTASASSDIDLVVEFRQSIGLKFVELVEYLEERLGRKVDVITPDGLKTIRVTGVAKNIVDDIVYV